jgi:hypothetical protein
MLILYVCCFVLKSVLVSVLCFACFVECYFFISENTGYCQN